MGFFKEYGVSYWNQEIVSDYIDNFRDVGRDLSEIIVQNNIRIMRFVLKNINTVFGFAASAQLAF